MALSKLIDFIKVGFPAAVLGLIYFLKRQRDNAVADKTLTDLKLQEVQDEKIVAADHAGQSDADVIQGFVDGADGSKPVPEPKRTDEGR